MQRPPRHVACSDLDVSGLGLPSLLILGYLWAFRSQSKDSGAGAQSGPWGRARVGARRPRHAQSRARYFTSSCPGSTLPPGSGDWGPPGNPGRGVSPRLPTSESTHGCPPPRTRPQRQRCPLSGGSSCQPGSQLSGKLSNIKNRFVILKCRGSFIKALNNRPDRTA